MLPRSFVFLVVNVSSNRMLNSWTGNENVGGNISRRQDFSSHRFIVYGFREIHRWTELVGKKKSAPLIAIRGRILILWSIRVFAKLECTIFEKEEKENARLSEVREEFFILLRHIPHSGRHQHSMKWISTRGRKVWNYAGASGPILPLPPSWHRDIRLETVIRLGDRW